MHPNSSYWEPKSKIFWGGSTAPLPTPIPLGASILAPSALSVPVPFHLRLEHCWCKWITDLWHWLVMRVSVTEMMLSRDPKEEMMKAFKLFDDDDSGKISLRNLKRVARWLNRTVLILCHFLTRFLLPSISYSTTTEPRAGSGVVRMDPLRFLAGCRTRRLNQA